VEHVACPDCDLLHAAVNLADGEEARCIRCDTTLPVPRPAPKLQAPAAIMATALAVFGVAICAPLMSISILGQHADATLFASAAYLWITGNPLAAVLVALFIVIFPAIYLGLLLASAIGALLQPIPRWAGLAARYARVIAPWAMPEVMLLATLVAYVKISQLADASPGLGMYATGSLALLLALGRTAVHAPTLWSRIDGGASP